MTHRTIRLAVVLPDPGEWCRDCEMLVIERYEGEWCAAGHTLSDDLRRPKSCRDAEIRDGDP